MKKIVIYFLFSLGFLFANQSVFACFCDIDGLWEEYRGYAKLTPEDFRQVLAEKKASVFIGKVEKIKKKKVKTESDDEPSKMQQVTIDVERYWVGVNSQKITVYTGQDAGACGIKYRKNQSYFFIAYQDEKYLFTGNCSYMFDGGNKINGYLAEFYERFLGNPLIFSKNQ